MKDIMVSDYQDCVAQMLLRNKSILDILSKLNISQAKVERQVVKAVTNCGCIKISGEKQPIPDSLEQMSYITDTHIRGELCSDCKSNIEKALGTNLFYFTALCNSLDIDMYDVILKEKDNLTTLGKFNMR